MPKIKTSKISSTFQKALKTPGLIDREDTSLLFYDLSALETQIKKLRANFPAETLHAIAAKANPLMDIIKKLRELGTGLEVASLPELHLALEAGFDHDKIVFDSPCKTREEIKFALEKGVYLNADSFAELERIKSLLNKQQNTGNIGLRINPQVGTGSIASTSVAAEISKFGVPLKEHREEIIRTFVQYSWLNGIHLHIGSQGCPVDLLIKGIRNVMKLATDINAMLSKQDPPRRITNFDLGGGLPVSYHFGDQGHEIKDYSNRLKNEIPELFSGEFRIITEFGRSIHANNACAVSRVEYVKKEKDHHIIITHLGADFMLRECYNPLDWHHEVSILDRHGKLKEGDEMKNSYIAGPLCFAGDVIAREINLPEVQEGDYVLIHDVGAYTLSMWSRYNSRQTPKVLGYEESGSYSILKEREEIKTVLNFWK